MTPALPSTTSATPSRRTPRASAIVSALARASRAARRRAVRRNSRSFRTSKDRPSIWKDSPIHSVADLKGQRIAVTRGTDPHIFLVRALATAGLTEHDVKLVLLQHPDGRTVLERGDVNAWAGLDPMMAASELESGARLFYRNAAANTWGVLNVREAFAADNPELVRRVLATYERARRWSVEHPAELKALMVAAMKLPDAVVARQLERNDLSSGAIGDKQAQTIIEAGKALQQAGVLSTDVDVTAVTSKLIDSSYARAAGA